MDWNPDYVYKIRGTWACRSAEQIIVYNLSNAMPTVLVPVADDEKTSKHRVSLYPEEWDDFGAEFYEHTLENDLHYIAPNADWHSQAESILAPGIKQFTTTDPEQLQLSIESLRSDMDANNG